jgi:leader peptidase (prepilin peptidase) / N-methyltransferase
MSVLIFVFGIFGLLIGSFLNVLILRHGERSIGGRSACMSCGRTLTWIDLVPVFSWIALRGKCRTCKSAISLQYPLVEATTAILFAAIGAAFFHGGIEISWHSLVILPYFAIAGLLICILVYDLYYMIIPDEWSYLFAGIALLTSLLSIDSGASVPAVLLGGPVAAFPLYVLWFVSKGKWMGLGDPKLALGIGWLLGPYNGLVAIFLAFVIGAVVAVCVLIPLSRLRSVGEQITIKSEVPFGPFLVVSTILCLLLTMYGIPLPLFTW